MNNDIIGFENMIFDIIENKIHLSGCGTTIKITIRNKKQFTKKILYSDVHIIISPRIQMIIFIKNLNLSNNKKFIFESIVHVKFIMYVHLMNQNITEILTQNESSLPILISRRMKFGELCEIPFDNCFQTSLNSDVAKISSFEITRPRIKINHNTNSFHFINQNKFVNSDAPFLIISNSFKKNAIKQ